MPLFGCAQDRRLRCALPFNPFISRPSNAPPDGEYHAGLHEADAPAPTSGAPKEISRNATFTQPFCQQQAIEAQAALLDCHHSSFNRFNAQPNARHHPPRKDVITT